MARLIDKDALIHDLCAGLCEAYDQCKKWCSTITVINMQPVIDAEPMRQGHWIECDYPHLEHGEIKTEPRAGWCCSVCHVGFRKKNMTYKQYCAHCGSKMVGGEDDDKR